MDMSLIARLTRRLQHRIECFQNARQQIIDAIDQNCVERTENQLIIVAQHRVFARALTLLEKANFSSIPPVGLVHNNALREVVSFARNRGCHSTSALANLVEEARASAWAEVLEWCQDE